MNLLHLLLLYPAVGCLEWYLALRRTLACARGERKTLVTITFCESLLGLWVLQNFITTGDWCIAISYSIGGAIGAYIIGRKNENDHRV